MFSQLPAENSETIVLVLRVVMTIVGLGVAGTGYLVFRSNQGAEKKDDQSDHRAAGWVALLAFGAMGIGVSLYAWLGFLA